MSDEHELHHLHAFLPHLAGALPELVPTLSDEDRPVGGRVTAAWVRSLPPRQRLSICRDWVRRAAESIRRESASAFRVLGAALLFPGEFPVSDLLGVTMAASVADIGDAASALARFEELGLLIHSHPRSLYVVPFPVRLAYEQGSLLEEPERRELERRYIEWHARVARALVEAPRSPREAGWQFSNLLGAYEFAAGWPDGAPAELRREIDEALVVFGEKLGRAAARRATDEGADLLEASIGAAERLGLSPARVDGLLLLGKFWLERGQPLRGMEAYRRCIEAAAAGGDARGMALAGSALAFVLRDRGDREGAIAQFRTACRAAVQGGLDSHARDIANCAAQLLLRASRAREARMWLQEFAPVAEDHPGASPAEAESLLLLARACLESDDLPSGMRVLEDVIARARGSNQIGLEARGLLSLARARANSTDDGFGEADARASHALFDQLGNDHGMADAALLIGRAARRKGDLPAARRWIEGALTRGWAIRDPLTIAQLHEERAEQFIAVDDERRAVAELCLARDEAKLGGDARYLAHLHLRLAELCARHGDAAVSIAEALRAQGIARADSWTDGAEAAGLFVEAARRATNEEVFERIVQEVSEELDSGRLLPQPRGVGAQHRKRREDGG